MEMYRNKLKSLIINLNSNQIENISEFISSLKNLDKLEYLEVNLGSNKLNKLPGFSLSENNYRV